jgi:hypothetical protein
VSMKITSSNSLTEASHCAQIDVSLGDDLRGGSDRGLRICEDSPCHFFTTALQPAPGCSQNLPQTRPGASLCLTLRLACSTLVK